MSQQDASFFINAKFTVTKFREGYDMDKVDQLLDTIAAAVAREDQKALHKVSEQILNAKFPTSKFREGYETGEVDEFLDKAYALVMKLRGQELRSGPTPHQAKKTFDGAFFTAVTFSQPRILASYDRQEVDTFIEHIKQLVWRNDPEQIRQLESEIHSKDFKVLSLFGRGYSINEVNDFMEEAAARAATY